MPRFSSLPLDVLREIRQQITLGDLLSHIALQATCKWVRSVYLTDETFWKAACIAAGIGRPIPCHEFPFVLATWRELAIICANHLEMCSLETCGWYKCPDDIFQELGNVALNIPQTRARGIDFEGFATLVNIVTGRSDSRRPSETHVQDKFGDRRFLHAASHCKFATVPPVCGIYITVFNHPKWVYNANGVTQWDVIQAVRQYLFSGADYFSPFTMLYVWSKYRKEVRELRKTFHWIKKVQSSDVKPYLKHIVENRRKFDRKLKSKIMIAILELYDLICNLPDQALMTLIYVEDTPRLDKCNMFEIQDAIKICFPEFQDTDWCNSLTKFARGMDFVDQRMMFVGLNTSKPIFYGGTDEDSVYEGDEGLPEFWVKWEPAEDDEAMELDQVEPAYDTQ